MVSGLRTSKESKHEWSVTLDRARYSLRYWQVWYSDLKNNSTSHMALGRIFKWAGLKDGDNDPLWDLEKVLEKLKAAQAALKVAQKQHKDNQDECLKGALEHQLRLLSRELDEPKAAKKAAAVVESIIRQHWTLESYARIKWVTKPGSGGGLQWVNVPKRDDDGNATQDEDGKEVREVLLEVDEIHKAILAQNKQHFHQADETPFAGGAKNTILIWPPRIYWDEPSSQGCCGRYLSGKVWQPTWWHSTCNGTSNQGTSNVWGNQGPWKEDWLWNNWRSIHLRLQEMEREYIDITIRQAFRVTIRPLYMIWISRSKNQNRHICKCETNFVAALVKLLNIWIWHGFAPKWWCTSIMVMIKKDPGNPWIECLRVIHLFEADYNLTLKLLWGKWLVHQGEDNNCFSKQQHGSRPWNQAINAVDMKTLTYDLTRILHDRL